MDQPTGQPRPAWVPDHLYPFEDHYINLDGNLVHYIDEGSCPMLLFMHGNPDCSFLYRDIILDLRTDFRCLALDFPGFGLSLPRDDYDFPPEAHSQVVAAFPRP